jgi:hypothetical protein
MHGKESLGVDGEALAEIQHLAAYPCVGFLVVEVVQYIGYPAT